MFNTMLLADHISRLALSEDLALFLDYDGTLVPFATSPSLAVPDPELLDLLHRLARRPHTEVHIVSGRSRESLDQMLGALPLSLHAEHGFWSHPLGQAWRAVSPTPEDALAAVLPVFQAFAARVPGAFVEKKSATLTWHYRKAPRDLGTRGASELRLSLAELLQASPLEILPGDRVVEVRPRGVDKGGVVRRAIEAHQAAHLPGGLGILALGDDTTDEDMFAVLPEGAVGVHVGQRESLAAFRVAHPVAARGLLKMLLVAASKTRAERRGSSRLNRP